MSQAEYFFPTIDLPFCTPIIAPLFIGVRLLQKYQRFKKPLVATLCIVAALWLFASTALYRVMRQPPERFAGVMSKIPGPIPFLILPFETLWMRARAGNLQIGDPAPDFSLAKLDKSDHVQLSSLNAHGRPVVLVFGSYT